MTDSSRTRPSECLATYSTIIQHCSTLCIQVLATFYKTIFSYTPTRLFIPTSFIYVPVLEMKRRFGFIYFLYISLRYQRFFFLAGYSFRNRGLARCPNVILKRRKVQADLTDDNISDGRINEAVEVGLDIAGHDSANES